MQNNGSQTSDLGPPIAHAADNQPASEPPAFQTFKSNHSVLATAAAVADGIPVDAQMCRGLGGGDAPKVSGSFA